MAGSGATQTFAELDAAANRLSRLLRGAGFDPGDHISVCMENHPRYLEDYGCWDIARLAVDNDRDAKSS